LTLSGIAHEEFRGASLHRAELRELEHSAPSNSHRMRQYSHSNLTDGLRYKLLPDGPRQIIGICRCSVISWVGDFRSVQLLRRRNRNRCPAPLFHIFAGPHALLGRRSKPFLIGWCDRLVRIAGPAKTGPLPMSRQDIADFLSLTVETVSQTLTKVERDGVMKPCREASACWYPKRAEALAAA